MVLGGPSGANIRFDKVSAQGEPVLSTCGEVYQCGTCACSVTGIDVGLWIIQNYEGEPLLEPIVQDIPPTRIEFAPSYGTGKVIVRAVRYEPIPAAAVSAIVDVIPYDGHVISTCEEVSVGDTCPCSVTGCDDGRWILTNEEGTPLPNPIVQDIPPTTIEFTPENTGKVLVIAVCFKPGCGTQEAIVTVQQGAPSTPMLYSISNPDCDGDYTVSWSSVSGATSYELQEDDNSAFPSPTTVYQGSGTSKSISGRSPKTYYYRVRACNAAGCSNWSSVKSVKVWLMPSTPTLDSISNPDGDGNYTVSWSWVADATYRLQEDDNPSFSSPSTAYSGSDTSKYIYGKSPGTYYYRVRAENCRGNSSWSNVQSVTVSGDITCPSISNISESHDPINKQGCRSPNTTTISAQITDPSGVAWARLYCRLNAGSWSYVTMSKSGNTYSATIGPFSEAGTVHYYIKARDNAGNECDSSTYTVTINDCEQCVGGWDVSNVDMNGQGNYIQVDPGEYIQVSLDYEIANDSDNPAVIQQIVIGVEDVAYYCAYDGIPTTCPGMTSGSDTHWISAPSDPGTYDLIAARDAQYNCNDAMNRYPNQSVKMTIGTIVVEEGGCPPDLSVFDPEIDDGAGL